MLNVGVIGCGVISEIYLHNLQNVLEGTRVTAVTDRDPERARLRAQAFSVPFVAATNSELLASPEVDVVLNLTIPGEHYRVSREALLAGKHVYSEKPLAMTFVQGRELHRLAHERDLLLACAPDTILGSGVQTARHLIEAGRIGDPFGFTAQMLWGGPASWHPDPEFLYREGAGPILDNGPYFIAALVHLLGSVTSVCTLGCRPFDELTIGSGPRAGTPFPVEVDTFTTAVLEFESGVVGSLTLSTEVPHSRMHGPRQYDHSIEIYGTRGVISFAPAFFDGTVMIRSRGSSDWTQIPGLYPYRDDSRGVGVADLADALDADRPPRIDADTSLHVLEVLMRLVESGAGAGQLSLDTQAQRKKWSGGVDGAPFASGAVTDLGGGADRADEGSAGGDLGV